VGYLTYGNTTVEAWQHIFEICAVIMILSGLVYVLFNDAALQSWNKQIPKETLEEQQQRMLKFINNEMYILDEKAFSYSRMTMPRRESRMSMRNFKRSVKRSIKTLNHL
jgi:uncharacterized membrane protein